MNFYSFLENFKTILNTQLFTLSGRSVTISSIIFFFLIIVLTWIISKYIRSLIRDKFSDRFEAGTGHTIRRLTHYSIMIIGFIVAIDFIGFDLTSLAVVAGFLSVGIGFGLQNITSNFISGLILMFERPISVGDIVTVDDKIGTIEDIGLRATTVNTVDNIHVVIPNSKFVQETVTNWTRGDQKIRIRLSVGVAYGSDVEKVKDILFDIAKNVEGVLEEPEPQVVFQEFGGSSLNFEFRVWVATPRDRIKVSNRVNELINERFEEQDVEMPFPQRDLHVRSSVPLETKNEG